MTARIQPDGARGALEVKRLRRAGLEIAPFAIAPGEAVALLGPSGSGKTLLLRAIADLDPNEGEVSLDGLSREGMPAPEWRRRVTYVATAPGWWAAEVGQHFPPGQREAAAALLRRFLLPPEALAWPVARLSTGEGQRISLARAFLGAPPALLLDEPTSALDEKAAEAVEQVLWERLREGLILLFSTHEPAQARRLARRVLRFSAEGRLREEAL